jgi:hypothetical protein
MPPARLAAWIPRPFENLGHVSGGAALRADHDQVTPAAAEPVGDLANRCLLALDELEVRDAQDVDGGPFHPPPRELLGVADVEHAGRLGAREALVEIRRSEVRHGLRLRL